MKFVSLFFVGFLVWSQTANAEINLTSESVVDGKKSKIHACRQKGGKDKVFKFLHRSACRYEKYFHNVDDPDAIKPAGKVWVHWNVFNIPVTTGDFSLDVGTKPAGTIGKGHGGSGYKGMCPPDGKHTYRIAIYAQKEDVKAKATGFNAVKYVRKI